MEKEIRTIPATELRVEGMESGQPVIVGYAAVFETESGDLGGFREKIRRGAFAKTLLNGADVRSLWNHDPNYVLGRTKSGTLKVYEDIHGLRIEDIPPDTQWARDLVVSIKRGDVDQMSFAFSVIRDEWEQRSNDVPMRTLLEVELYDVSPVTYPAYPQTTVGVRNMAQRLSTPNGAAQESATGGTDQTDQATDQIQADAVRLVGVKLGMIEKQI